MGKRFDNFKKELSNLKPGKQPSGKNLSPIHDRD